MKGKTKKIQKTVQGIISITSKGIGYVRILNEVPTPNGVGIPTSDRNQNVGKDPEIDFRHLNTALHGDMVEITLHPKGKGRLTAEVLKIISRAKMGFSGVLEKEDGIYFLKPDDTKMYTDILIPEKMLNGAKAGQKVYTEIIFWKDGLKAPEGKIIKVLGKPGDNNAEMHAIAIEKGFDSELPQKVEEEAEKIKSLGIKNEDYNGRRDFRKTLTFTIDPDDAKDFDDAISFRILPPLLNPSRPPLVRGGKWFPLDKGEQGGFKERGLGGEVYEIGIHIADVSHYVKIGSEIDKEAKKRGTSVYLVDRTIPMLPEVLSNDLCSLVPNKDRLTMSAVFVLDKNAQVKKEWYGRTVIHSQKRFTYEEAEKSIKENSAPLHKELFILNNLAKKLNKERFANGAISLEQEEVKFVLDKNGTPLKVIKKVRGDSNKLIEEFMLLANKKVAETISKGTKKDGGVFVYRIHDNPSKEKMTDLAFFLRSLGYKISLIDGVIPNYELNNLLKSLEGKNEENTVNRAIIRSMAKAIYSTKNVGHYGLAFEYYAHFTSPIRRYPDVVVHRLLTDYLKGLKVGKEKLSIYEEISRKASEREKFASDAERASIKYKQVEYMSSRISKTFEGIISGITEWGIYVEEVETKCEGLVRVRDMEDNFYIFNEKKLELVGQGKKSRRPLGPGSRPKASGKKYRLGDRVKIKVKSVDLERKTIDYALTT
ncbi:MAG: VacB/RNase II family 3'-5' exoribonuclease [Candidatus Nomurabacteria bacterium]|nr:VacB/RNase II family 3'-5' exoribonuclease [Candidatus Nomurabacteria bacterium]